MRALWIVTMQSFVLLRRDKIFLPVLITAAIYIQFANMASTWSVEDTQKILYDVGFFGLWLIGSLVAVIWGTKAVADSRQEGSLEVQLAAPISRSTWLIGKFLGLCLGLAFLSVAMLGLWYAFVYLNFGGILLTTKRHAVAFAYLCLGWVVVAALGFFFSASSRQGVALFSTISAWVVGLLAAPIDIAIGTDTTKSAKQIVSFVARYWDFQQFNFVDQVSAGHMPGRTDLVDRGLYGLLLTGILIALSCVIFQRRDLIA